MMESSVLSVKAICLLIASNNFFSVAFTDVLGIELTSVYIFSSYSCPVYSGDSIL